MAVSRTPNPSGSELKLERLLELQELDREILLLEDQREDLPLRAKRQDEAVYEARRSQEENDNQIAMIEEEITVKTRMRDLDRIRKKNAKSKEAAIESLAQYDALLKDMESGEITTEDIEASLRVVHGRLDELKAAKARLKAEVAELTRAREEGRLAMQARLEELDQLLDTMYDRRDDLAETIEERLFLKYERIAERKGGIAVARVEHGHCLECNMAIPPQLHNELMRGNTLMVCPACNRILVYIDPAS